MRKIFIIYFAKTLVILGFIVLNLVIPIHNSIAQQEESEESADEEVIDKLKQIKILKEKIATKVAELRDQEKGGVVGTAKEVAESKITLITQKGERVVTAGEDVIIYSIADSKRSQSTLEDIKVGDKVTALGYFNAEKTELTASYIYLRHQTNKRLVGKIADIDAENFTITVKSLDGAMVVDVEKYTRTFAYDKQKGEFARSGFSKMKTQDILHITGELDHEEENRILADKIYIFSFETASASPLSTPVDE